MTKKERADKILDLGDRVTAAGFKRFTLIAWDEEDRWAASVSEHIEPKRLRDAAKFLNSAADGA